MWSLFDDNAAPALRQSVALKACEVSWLKRTLLELAPQDLLILAYFVLLFVAVAFGAGPSRPLAGRIVLEHLAVLAAGLALSRGGILRRGGFLNGLVYRVTLFATVVSSYFELRLILPAAAPRTVDATLYAIDTTLFHYEPSLAWDRFVTPATTEWFAFFYFGYFIILAAHVLPFMFFGANMAVLARFSTAIFIVFCAGHLLYIVVPGFGPHLFLAGGFTHELAGGFFWRAVQATVADAGAQKDIFPSLHTAVPSMFSLLAFIHRRDSPAFRVSWPITLGCTSQIIIATMFLRWHYLIDICAGLALAGLAVLLAERLVPWDDTRRARRELFPAWTALFKPREG